METKKYLVLRVVVKIQFSSVAQLCPTLCDPMDCSTRLQLSITNSQSLLKLRYIESVMPSNHLLLCRPLLPLPSIFANSRVFSSAHQVAKVLGLQFQYQFFQVNSGLISFRIDWFDLLAVQGTLKSLLQHHSPKASVLWRLVFFMV